MWQIFHIREEIGTHQHEIDDANKALSKIQHTDEQIVAELKAKKKDFAILAREKSTIDKVCAQSPESRVYSLVSDVPCSACRISARRTPTSSRP